MVPLVYALAPLRGRYHGGPLHAADPTGVEHLHAAGAGRSPDARRRFRVSAVLGRPGLALFGHAVRVHGGSARVRPALRLAIRGAAGAAVAMAAAPQDRCLPAAGLPAFQPGLWQRRVVAWPAAGAGRGERGAHACPHDPTTQRASRGPRLAHQRRAEHLAQPAVHQARAPAARRQGAPGRGCAVQAREALPGGKAASRGADRAHRAAGVAVATAVGGPLPGTVHVHRVPGLRVSGARGRLGPRGAALALARLRAAALHAGRLRAVGPGSASR
mmetsp:Transcript_82041/g.244724  ORF Transcript_82041/g.244724 Transcript_82041/m.244724 type:complete len:273 (+) Transcript_82041:235-1053(+)